MNKRCRQGGSEWMLFKETVQMAISALWANKMRSLLTMLGIIIGVGAVIAMVSIGMGVRKQVEDSIASLGSNMLIINASATKKMRLVFAKRLVQMCV